MQQWYHPLTACFILTSGVWGGLISPVPWLQDVESWQHNTAQHLDNMSPLSGTDVPHDGTVASFPSLEGVMKEQALPLPPSSSFFFV